MSARLLALLYLCIRKGRAVKHLKESQRAIKTFVVTHYRAERKLGQDTSLLNL